MSIKQTIELDCVPGFPRPGDIIGHVIKDTGLPPREPVSMFFGCWTWDYNDIPTDVWRAARPTLQARITEFYDTGVIRYGSW